MRIIIKTQMIDEVEINLQHESLTIPKLGIANASYVYTEDKEQAASILTFPSGKQDVRLILSNENRRQFLWARSFYTSNRQFLVNVREIAMTANANPLRDKDDCYVCSGQDIFDALSGLFSLLFQVRFSGQKNSPDDSAFFLDYLVKANSGYAVVELSGWPDHANRRFRINYGIILDD